MSARRKRWEADHAEVVALTFDLEMRIRRLGRAAAPLIFPEETKVTDPADPDCDPAKIAEAAAGAAAGIRSLVDNLYQRVVMRGNPKA